MKKFAVILLAMISACCLLTACNSGHDHKYAESWSYDATHHYHQCTIDGCKETTDKSVHTYDNACDSTCDCGYERVAPHDYVWEKDDEGHYQICQEDGCGEQTTKVAHNYDHACDSTCECGYERVITHDFSDLWEKDENEHWHVCQTQGCDEIDAKAGHVFDNACDTTCECGYERAITHDYVWEKDDEGHYQKCQVVGCGAQTTKVAHNYDHACDPTCECGYERVITHDFSGLWEKDENEHWHVCQTQGCGEIDEKRDHNYDDGEITTPATPEKDGEKTFTCLNCGQEKIEKIEYQEIKDERVSETQWNDTMNYGGNVIRNVTVNHPNLGQLNQREIIYGDIIKLNESDYLVKDGDTYTAYDLWVEIEDGIKYDVWSKQTVSGEQFNSLKYAISFFADKYDSFTYDAQRGIYVAESLVVNKTTITNIEMSFKDGRVVSFSYLQDYGQDKLYTRYDIEYKTIEIKLPNMDKVVHVCKFDWLHDDHEHAQVCYCDDYKNEGKHAYGVGIQDGKDVVYTCIVCGYKKIEKDSTAKVFSAVTNQEFIAAMSATDNFVRTIVLSAYIDGEVVGSETETLIMYNGIAKFPYDLYYAKEGDAYYRYTKEEGSNNFDKIEIEEEEYLFSVSMMYCADMFDSLIFNAKTGLYVAKNVTIGEEFYAQIKMGFSDGKIAYLLIEYLDGEYSIIEECSFSYETWEIELPQLHTCSYEEKSTIPPTCNKDGYDLYTCECGNSYKDNFVPATKEHSYGSDGKCISCGLDQKVALLDLKVIPDDEGKGIGYEIVDCDESISGELTIPETYNDLPIIKIGFEAFKYCSNLTKLILPDNMYVVDDRFYGCDSFEFNIYNGDYYLGTADNPYALFVKIGDVKKTTINFHEDVKLIGGYACWTVDWSCDIKTLEIPNTVISIGRCAFNSCSDLTYLTFESDSRLEYISDYAFSDSNIWGTIILPDTVKHIGDGAFRDNNVKFINIPDGIETIQKQMFNNSYKILYQIVIPTSVKSIEESALLGIYHSAHIYYKGTPEQWKQINIHSSNNYYMNNVNYYYYSETEPTDMANKYWYMSKNGVTPLIWGEPDVDIKDYILDKAEILHESDFRHQIASKDGLNVFLCYKSTGMSGASGRITLYAEYQKSSSVSLSMEIYLDYLKPYFKYYSYGEYKADATPGLLDGSTFTLDSEMIYEVDKESVKSYLEDFTYMLRQSLIELNNYIKTNETPITFERFGMTAIKFD